MDNRVVQDTQDKTTVSEDQRSSGSRLPMWEEANALWGSSTATVTTQHAGGTQKD
jgi:hypothetical protein